MSEKFSSGTINNIQSINIFSCEVMPMYERFVVRPDFCCLCIRAILRHRSTHDLTLVIHSVSVLQFLLQHNLSNINVIYLYIYCHKIQPLHIVVIARFKFTMCVKYGVPFLSIIFLHR